MISRSQRLFATGKSNPSRSLRAFCRIRGKALQRGLCLIALTTSCLGLAWAEPTADAQVRFKDVPENHWAAPAINNCVRLGITKGYADGTFKGENTINRYELMSFLNNSYVSMEKMMDNKIENSFFQNDKGALSQKAMEEMRAEIAGMKEEIAALRVEKPNDGNLTVKLALDIYRGEIIAPQDMPTRDKSFREGIWNKEFDLLISKNISAQTGFEAHLKAQNSTSPYGTGKVWTSRQFSPDVNLSLYAESGPGQALSSDKRLIDNPYPGFGFGLGLYSVSFNCLISDIGTASSFFDPNVGGLISNLAVNRNTVGLAYKIPTEIPYLGQITLGVDQENYYTLKDRTYNDQKKTIRNIGKIRFDIAKNIAIRTLYIEEGRFTPSIDSNLEPTHEEKHSIYSEVELLVGDIFKSGTEWSIMTASKGSDFGTNGLDEPWPARNYLGYATGKYFSDPRANTVSQTTSASISLEQSARVRQDLYNKELFLNLAYVSGRALPDKDKTAYKDDDTVYTYTLSLVGIDWYIQKNFKTYFIYEAHDLDDSALTSSQDNYYEKLGYCGVALIF